MMLAEKKSLTWKDLDAFGDLLKGLGYEVKKMPMGDLRVEGKVLEDDVYVTVRYGIILSTRKIPPFKHKSFGDGGFQYKIEI